VTVNLGSADFGTVEVGTRKTLTFTIENRNPIRALFMVETPLNDLEISIKSAILEPLQEVLVGITWLPESEYCLDGLTLQFTGATHSQLFLKGNGVQPLVQFKCTKIDLGKLFVGVKKVFEVELINFSPIGAHFQFIPVEILPRRDIN
jgi:hypothetical protein